MKKIILILFLVYSSFFIFAQSFHLQPNDTSVCKMQDYFHLKLISPIDSYPINNNIYWTHYYRKNFFQIQDSTELVGNNLYNILVNEPGKYHVIVTDSNSATLLNDTSVVHYSNIQPINLAMTINNINADFSTPICIFSNSVDISTIISSADNCTSFSASDFTYIWCYDDNAIEQGQGLDHSSHFYSEEGNYLLKLIIIDQKKSEHIYYQRIFILPNNNDTLKLNLENNSDLILDLKNLTFFNLNMFNKNRWTNQLNINFLANNTENIVINITGSQISKIQNAKDISFYVKFAAAGDLNFSVQSPNNKIITVNPIVPVSSYTYIWGFPAVEFSKTAMSISNSYIFGQYPENILPVQIPSYFSPDEQIIKKNNLNEMKSGYYNINSIASLVDEPVNGNWILSFTTTGINTSYGRLEELGIIINKNYFKYNVLPDSMICTDQFGRSFKMSQIKELIITNNSSDIYELSCQVQYPNLPCVIQKNIEIKLPTTPTVQYFSPNNDGINDYWLPVSPNSGAQIIIIDKLGNIVANFNADQKPEGWNGTFNDKPLPSDSYWFIIQSNNFVNKGVINIVR